MGVVNRRLTFGCQETACGVRGADIACRAMLAHLGRVARHLRQERGVKLVRIGATINKGEGSLSRFEAGQNWSEIERVVDAYAEELGVTPIELWRAALKEWEKG